jgi:uncharacterized protein (TIGR02145 family)
MIKTKNIVVLILIVLSCFCAVAQTGDSSGTSTFTDMGDNKTYRTKRIGNRTWMVENLNSKTDNSWCYENNSSNCTKYGRLYEWKAAKNACQKSMGDGWRLPLNEDWDDLVNYVGGEEIAGKRLRSKSGWSNKKNGASGNGTDNFGFSALPGGNRFPDGFFLNVGNKSHWWSATEDEASYAHFRDISHNYDVVYEGSSAAKEFGFSVRCVAD